MKPVIRFFALLLFISVSSIPLFAQTPGDLDTSFHIRTNYGALFPIEKAWPLADGSVMCYSTGGNYFSGRPTGSFFRLLSNGELDTTNPSVPFSFSIECGMCACYLWGDVNVTSTGKAYAWSSAGFHLNQKKISKRLIRFTQTGLDTLLTQDATVISSLLNRMPLFLRTSGSGILIPSTNGIKYYSEDLVADSVHGNFATGANESIKMQCLNDTAATFLLDSAGKYFLLPYSQSLLKFRDKIRIQPKKNAAPFLLGMDAASRVYEYYPYSDTVQSKVYHKIYRRKLTGEPDSGYTITLLSTGWVPIQNFEILPNGKVIYSGTYIFSAANGLLVDSVSIKKTLSVKTDTYQVEMGPDSNNHWTYQRKDADGVQILVEKKTRFGPNGEIKEVLADKQGRALIWGDFTETDGIPTVHLARLEKNGLIDSTFQCSLFKAGDKGNLKHISIDSATQKILIINSLPFGSLSRLVYRLLPNGSLDTSFNYQGIQSYASSITEIRGADRMISGSILLTVQFSNPSDSMRSHLIKLASNGSIDNTFLVRSCQQMYPNLYYGNCERTKFFTVERLYPNMLRVQIRRIYCGDTPVCKSATENEIQYWDISRFIDSTGSDIQPPQGPDVYDDYWTAKDLPQNAHCLFYNERNAVNSELQIDSTFKVRNADGTDYNDQIWPVAKVTHGDLFYVKYISYPDRGYRASNFPYVTSLPSQNQLIKSNSLGYIDTTFGSNIYYGNINSVAIPDTAHLYIAGSFNLRNYKTIPPLVRIHNGRSTVTANAKNQSAQNSVRVYPNPIRETLFLSGWKPGTELMVTNVQGKVWFHETVTESIRTESLRLVPGIYFWKATRNGSTQGFGKLVKE
jgi:hypothetical protein